MVMRSWTAMVARLNELEESALGGVGEVDHFIPWSRYRDDGLDNLVLADRGCNGAKRDFLASARHVRRWRARMESPAVPDVAKARNWPRHPETTLGVARAVYLRLPAGSPLCDGTRSFVRAERNELVKAVA